MKNLYIVRHGESFTNKNGVLTGWIDTPLTPGGIQEATATGRILSTIDFDLVLTSKLSRAVQTALLIAAYNNFSKAPIIIHSDDELNSKTYNNINGYIASNSLPIMCNELLNERYYGELQGILLNQIKEKYSGDPSLWSISFANYECAESLNDLKLRAGSIITNFLIPHFETKNNILLVSHSTLLRVMLSIFENISLDEAKIIPIKNCSVIQYEVTDNNFLRKGISPILI